MLALRTASRLGASLARRKAVPKLRPAITTRFITDRFETPPEPIPDELPRNFDVGERARELGVMLSEHELEKLVANLKQATKKDSNAAYLEAVSAEATRGAERNYLSQFIVRSDETSLGQRGLVYMDWMSTSLFALIGAQYAGVAGMNVVGATLVGVIGAVGGGTLTGLLTGGSRNGVFWMRDPRYLVVSMVVSILTFYGWPRYEEHTAQTLLARLLAAAGLPAGQDRLSERDFNRALGRDVALALSIEQTVEPNLTAEDRAWIQATPTLRPGLYFAWLAGDQSELRAENLMVLARKQVTDSSLLYSLETLALGSVAVFGAQAGITRALPPAACVATGVTICFGGVFRDVLCRRDVAIGGQSYALATAMGSSVYVGLRQMVVRGFYIPLLARMSAAFAVTIAERIYVYYDHASDRFLAPWPRWARDAFVDPVA